MEQITEKSIVGSSRYKAHIKYITLLMSLILIAIDQGLKYLVVVYLKPLNNPIVLIEDYLQLSYVENSGAAFGLLQGKRWLLTVMVTLIIGVYLYLLLSDRIRDNFIVLTSSLILAGGVGNLLDRVLRGYVIDFIDISPWFHFPVFNFADCLVVVGCILLMIYLLFFLKDEPEDVSKGKDESSHSENEAV